MRLFSLLLFIAVVFSSSSARADDAAMAKALIQQAGMDRGVCVILGNQGDLPLEMAKASHFLIQFRSPQATTVRQVLQQSSKAGLGIQRLTADQGSLTTLPQTSNTIDLLVIPSLPKGLAAKEAIRALRPGGMALVIKGTEAKLKAWLKGTKVDDLKIASGKNEATARFTKPALAGVDDWSHWEKSPDNNPVSNDSVIKAPYMTQYMAGPFYIGMPAVTTAAGGRTFLAIGHIAHHRREWDMLNKIIAKNGYNGSILWTKDLPEGYLVHRSAFIATEKTLYMIAGDRCALLDAKTGKVQGTITIPGLDGEWKWIAMKNGILYAAAGKKDPRVETTKGDRTFGGWSWADLSKGYYGKNGIYNRSSIPWGNAHSLAAFDLQKKNVLWTHKAEKPIDSRSLAMVDNKLFYMSPGSFLRGISTTNGKELWTSKEANIINLIKEPGKGLTSTPGFKTMCLTVATPQALIIQGQTRMNVVAVSTKTGKFLWSKRKVTNNPNAIYVDGKVIVGVGRGGTHVALDPVTGKEEENFGFRKRACTRLTASTDSFFCRGEGLMRYDRQSKKMLIDGSARPACNDGAMPANGLLYIGPWQCDCNLSLIGNIARCSAGGFRFDHVAKDADRLLQVGNLEKVEPFQITEADWPTYRANLERSASTKAKAAAAMGLEWVAVPQVDHVPTVPVAAGGLVFVAGENGTVRALSAKTGKPQWTFPTGSPIKYPPTIQNGRAYFGSGNGYAYCVEAATGRLLWKFRAAPVERQLMVYGHLCSTWPVNSGVLVHKGVAYFAAGIIDQDGTYVYAVDAKTGKLKWCNHESGHLNTLLRKGVSVQGNLTIQGDKLLMAGGNQVSPAVYELETGKSLSKPFVQGEPKANGGKFVGSFQKKMPIIGGRILYSAPRNVATKGSFAIHSGPRAWTLNFGGIPPAWNDSTLAMVNFRHGKLTCCDVDKVMAQIAKGYSGRRPAGRFRLNLATALEEAGAVRWQSDLGESRSFEAVSMAICPNAIVAVVRYQPRVRSQPTWFLASFNPKNGNAGRRQQIRGEPLPGGLLVDAKGRAVITLIDGRVVCFGPSGAKPAGGGGDRPRK